MPGGLSEVGKGRNLKSVGKFRGVDVPRLSARRDLQAWCCVRAGGEILGGKSWVISCDEAEQAVFLGGWS